MVTDGSLETPDPPASGPGQPPPGIVHRSGSTVRIARAEQADQPVPEVVLLQKSEDRDHKDDPQLRDRSDDRLQDAPAELQHGRGLRLGDDHRNRLGAPCLLQRPGTPRLLPRLCRPLLLG